jgi:hypothetical protein
MKSRVQGINGSLGMAETIRVTLSVLESIFTALELAQESRPGKWFVFLNRIYLDFGKWIITQDSAVNNDKSLLDKLNMASKVCFPILKWIQE